MQQGERKGAWVLFVAVLLFGALVWGLGGRMRRDEEKKEKERNEAKQQEYERQVAAESDSIAAAIEKAAIEKAEADSMRKAERKTKSGKKDVASTSHTSAKPTRDILSDSIPTKRK